MPQDDKEFYEGSANAMELIKRGVWPHEFSFGNMIIKMNILDEKGFKETNMALNNMDAMIKFPMMKFETVARAITHVDGMQVPDLQSAKKFLNKLPDIIVDMFYMEYDVQKNMRDNSIRDWISELKKSSGSQTQEGTGNGQNNSDLSGSENSTATKS